MEDGDVKLFESGAILLYLASRYGKLDVEQMAAAGQWTLFANSTLCETLFNEQRRWEWEWVGRRGGGGRGWGCWGGGCVWVPGGTGRQGRLPAARCLDGVDVDGGQLQLQPATTGLSPWRGVAGGRRRRRQRQLTRPRPRCIAARRSGAQGPAMLGTINTILGNKPYLAGAPRRPGAPAPSSRSRAPLQRQPAQRSTLCAAAAASQRPRLGGHSGSLPSPDLQGTISVCRTLRSARTCCTSPFSSRTWTSPSGFSGTSPGAPRSLPSASSARKQLSWRAAS
jgi:hypothetical protein